jgi:hypothetical protein
MDGNMNDMASVALEPKDTILQILARMDEIRQKEKELNDHIDKMNDDISRANQEIEGSEEELKRLMAEEMKLKKETQSLMGGIFHRTINEEEREREERRAPKKWVPRPTAT